MSLAPGHERGEDVDVIVLAQVTYNYFCFNPVYYKCIIPMQRIARAREICELVLQIGLDGSHSMSTFY